MIYQKLNKFFETSPLLTMLKIVSMIRKYHNHKRQTTPCHREEEPLKHHETPGRQTKQSNQLSLPHQDIAILEWTLNNVQQNIEQLQTTGPRSAVGNVSGNRCESDCRSRGREFDPGPVPLLSWRLIMK